MARKNTPNKSLSGKVDKVQGKVKPTMGPTAKQPTGPVGKNQGATTGKKKKK